MKLCIIATKIDAKTRDENASVVWSTELLGVQGMDGS